MTDAASRLDDPNYVRFQYLDDQRLRIRIQTHERYSENPVPFTRWILGHLAAEPGQRLLDVGSGPGQYHTQLANVRVVAMDLSAGMLARVSVPAVQADAQALPFASGAFERVMANHVLYHVQDIANALREIRRVLAPGGRAVMATNSGTTMRPLFELIDAIAADVGVGGYKPVGLRFGLEHVDEVRGPRCVPERAHRDLRRRVPVHLSGAGARVRREHVDRLLRPGEARRVPTTARRARERHHPARGRVPRPEAVRLLRGGGLSV